MASTTPKSSTTMATIFPCSLHCTDYQICDNTTNTCACIEGYFQIGAGAACHPRNYCDNGSDNDCDEQLATCIPLLGDASRGFFRCECAKGYTTPLGFKIGRNCVPHDECSDGAHDCSLPNEICKNLEPPLTYACIPNSPAPVAPTPTAPTPGGGGTTPSEDEDDPEPDTSGLRCQFSCGSNAFCAAERNQCVCFAGHSGNPNSICLDNNLVTPDIIFEPGNIPKGDFTIHRVELGLRTIRAAFSL